MAAHQAPPSLGFSRQEHWNGLPFPSPVTLSNPMDCSLPGSSVYGIFQARVLEWGAIAFSAWQATHSQWSFRTKVSWNISVIREDQIFFFRKKIKIFLFKGLEYIWLWAWVIKARKEEIRWWRLEKVVSIANTSGETNNCNISLSTEKVPFVESRSSILLLKMRKV